MNALQIFLNALEERLNGNGEHRGNFICKQNIELCTFKAYKHFIQEVWIIDGEYKQLVARAEYTALVVTDEAKSKALEELYSLTIKEVLRYYGI